MGSADSDPTTLLLLIADLDGYPAIVRRALASRESTGPRVPQLVLIGGHDQFPFKPRPSTILLSAMPAGVIACSPAMDEVGIASRLASTEGLPGCFDGTVVELAQIWLQSVNPVILRGTGIIVSAADQTAVAVEALGRSMNVRVNRLATR